MRKLSLVLAVCALLAISIVPAFAQDSNAAHVRFAHLAPGAGEADFFVNGEVSDAAGLNLGDVSDWAEMDAGTYSVAVVPAGSTLDDAVIGPTDVEVAAGDWVTVAAIGSVDHGTGQIVGLVEDVSELDDTDSRISLFNSIPDAGPLSLQTADGEVLIQTLAYPGTLDLGDGVMNDGLDSVDVVNGSYDLQITPFDDASTVLLDIPSLTLAPGKHYFIAATGLVANPISVVVDTDVAAMTSGPEATAAPVETGEGPLQVRFAHFAQGTGEVDVYVNGELSDIQGLNTNDITDWMEMNAGIYSVAVAPVGTSLDQAVIGPVDVALIADEWITVAAIGSVELGAGDIQTVVENFDAIPVGETRVTLMHAVPNLDPVSLQLADGTVLIQTLAFPGMLGDNDGASSVDLLQGTYDLQITPSGDTSTVLFDLPDLELDQRKHYFIAISGLAADAVTVMTVTDTRNS